MQIERVDPLTDADAVKACHEIYAAAIAVDDPAVPPMSLRTFTAWLTYGWTEDPAEMWAASDAAGAMTGWYWLSLPQRENVQLGYVDVCVHPSRRRAGLGTALLARAAARARQHARRTLIGESREDSPGSGFACAVGARRGLGEVRRILRLAERPAGHLAALRAQAEQRAAGYSLEAWTGPVPERDLAAVAAVYSAAEDRPLEPGQEPQLWDLERVRLANTRTEMQGLRAYTIAARSDVSGEVAGLTQLGVDPEHDTWGFQQLTAVAREHRGRRLGLLVKLEMLDLLAEREPQLIRILTGNADANEHMIAINAALGYEVLDRWQSFEMDTHDGARAARQG